MQTGGEWARDATGRNGIATRDIGPQRAQILASRLLRAGGKSAFPLN